MGGRDEAIGCLTFLNQSPVRIRILNLLSEEKALTKGELTKQVNVSRVTIQRNLEALAEYGWLKPAQSEYTITPAGELVSRELTSVIDSIQLERKLHPFLRWLPRDSFDLDPQLLRDATVISTEPTDPYNWVRYHIDRLSTTSHLRLLLPLIGDEGWEVTTTRLRNGELTAEFIADTAVATTLRTNPRYTDTVDQLRTTEGFELFLYEGTFPFGIGIFDQYVQMIVADDDGMPQALIETQSERVHEWAEATFKDYREKSKRFTF
ncbi:helix-turn-helix transcriptional regulator [Natrialbaceae archaeon GCM10025810]|uniref:helix-turn-helix transcriptional regulator n=1 Tax=Halovalidus salilacus TaxID=3075124 RepID=UPI0036220570